MKSIILGAIIFVGSSWADNPEGCNLISQEGLSASPFRIDNRDRK